MKIIKNLVSESKYSIKCPYHMEAEFIVVHNTANNASASNEIAYMIRNNNQVSYHYAVDDRQVIQGIPENRNAWHAGDGGNGAGNRKGLSIEICYSKNGGPLFSKAEENASEFIAQLLKERGWSIDRVKKHQDFSGKYCPHRTLDYGWDRFLKMIESHLNGEEIEKPDHELIGRLEPCNGFVEVIYRGADGVDLHSKPTFTGYVAGVAMKGAVYTVKGKIKVNGHLMYQLKSGAYITGSKEFVSFRTTLHSTGSTDLSKVKVGAKVMIRQDAKKYATGETIAGYYKGVKYTIKQVSEDKTKVLIEELLSWAWTKDIIVL